MNSYEKFSVFSLVHNHDVLVVEMVVDKELLLVAPELKQFPTGEPMLISYPDV